ncbi:hypothetical protein CMV30_04440 [Nibricoccus aquaticus]|uniref:FAD dependent oxidoreductase domain-containing protein n=1 Tax=Nibricoccus aquaticus TaxID=2576891 RepID=A0A290QHB7_9BACT|nr:FAD-binding oxidoreductase [Nibricoccus aquaticus]ATC63262.1 hypothetical protein CMV30_04440 [Nibricoccus aquaticus]
MDPTLAHWLASSTLPRFPRLGTDLTTDVIIVGGGIVGITTAILCQRAGLTFALIERDRLARMDSGLTSAHLTAVSDLRFSEIVSNFGRRQARAIWDAGISAIDQIASLIRTENIACDFKWLSGFLHAPRADDFAMDNLIHEAAASRELGIPSDYISSIPVFHRPGVRFPRQAVFNPRKFLAGLVRNFGGKGSHVFEQTSVDEIQNRPIAIKAGNFTVTGRHLVLATHAAIATSSHATELKTPLAIVETHALSAKLPSQIAEGLFWDTDSPYHHLRIENRRSHDFAIFGGEDHAPGDSDAVHAPTRLAKRFMEIFPDATIDRQWSGHVVETSDGLPLIGSTTVDQFIATGFGGNGLTFGTLAACMAIDSIFARPNPWTVLFNPHRGKPGSYPPFGFANTAHQDFSFR